MKRFVVFVVSLVPVAALAGCGDDKGTVHGTITFDGKPVPAGAITFVKIEGEMVREGAVIQDGKFQARMPPGKYKIEVYGRKVVGKKIEQGMGGKDEVFEDVGQLFPERYNTATELTVEVQAGRNDLPLELHSNN